MARLFSSSSDDRHQLIADAIDLVHELGHSAAGRIGAHAALRRPRTGVSARDEVAVSAVSVAVHFAKIHEQARGSAAADDHGPSPPWRHNPDPAGPPRCFRARHRSVPIRDRSTTKILRPLDGLGGSRTAWFSRAAVPFRQAVQHLLHLVQAERRPQLPAVRSEERTSRRAISPAFPA